MNKMEKGLVPLFFMSYIQIEFTFDKLIVFIQEISYFYEAACFFT